MDLPAAPAPKPQAPAFSLVVTIDGWMVRQRGVDWGAKPGVPAKERVAWKEVKSAVIYRFEDHAINDSGRGMLIEKKVVIGSGSIESVCSQFQDRLKRRGRFWSPRGLANLLVIDVTHKNNTVPILWN